MTDEGEWVAGWDALCVSLVRPLTAIDAAQAIAQADVQEFADRQAAEDWVFGSEEYDRSWFVYRRSGWLDLRVGDERLAGRQRGERPCVSGIGEMYTRFSGVIKLMRFVVVATDGLVMRLVDLFFDERGVSGRGVLGWRGGGDGWEDSPRTSGSNASLAGGGRQACHARLARRTGRPLLGAPFLRTSMVPRGRRWFSRRRLTPWSCCSMDGRSFERP